MIFARFLLVAVAIPFALAGGNNNSGSECSSKQFKLVTAMHMPQFTADDDTDGRRRTAALITVVLLPTKPHPQATTAPLAGPGSLRKVAAPRTNLLRNFLLPSATTDGIGPTQPTPAAQILLLLLLLPPTSPRPLPTTDGTTAAEATTVVAETTTTTTADTTTAAETTVEAITDTINVHTAPAPLSFALKVQMHALSPVSPTTSNVSTLCLISITVVDAPLLAKVRIAMPLLALGTLAASEVPAKVGYSSCRFIMTLIGYSSVYNCAEGYRMAQDGSCVSIFTTM